MMSDAQLFVVSGGYRVRLGASKVLSDLSLHDKKFGKVKRARQCKNAIANETRSKVAGDAESRCLYGIRFLGRVSKWRRRRKVFVVCYGWPVEGKEGKLKKKVAMENSVGTGVRCGVGGGGRATKLL